MNAVRALDRLKFLILAGFLPIFVGTASAADISGIDSSQEDTGWGVYWPTYLWAAGMNGTARTLPPLPDADVDISFGDSLEALKDLDAGLITTVFIHNNRFRMMADVNWMRLSPEDKFDVNGTSAKLSLDSETLTLMGAVGYRLVDEERLALDVYVGAKYWFMENAAKVEPAEIVAPAPNSVSKENTWVDGVVGAHLTSDITDHAYISLIGLVGTGGSKFYGDAYGGIGYRFNDKYDAFAGYRAMKVDHEEGNFSYDVLQHGPLLGFGVKF